VGLVLEMTDEDLKLLDELKAKCRRGFRHVRFRSHEQEERMLVTTHAATPIGQFRPKEHYLGGGERRTLEASG